jgi:hypothetical protein
MGKVEPKTIRYIVREIGDDDFDVIHLGPYVVSKSLKLKEALALAAALNQENKDR